MIQDVDLSSVKKKGENQGIFWIPWFFFGGQYVFSDKAQVAKIGHGLYDRNVYEEV